MTFSWQCQIFVPMHLYGKNIEKLFSENLLKTNGLNLQCMITVVNLLRASKVLSPGGYLS